MNTAIRVICFTILLSAFPFRAAAEDFTNAIHAYLQQRVEVEKRDVGMVVGIVDEHGSRIISYGKMDNGTDQEVNGDTVFAIHSTTGTFTRLLLQDMIERGEMTLDDPVAKYLPKSVKMPTRNGKEITLRHLAAESSGLPTSGPDNLDPKRADDPFADFTVEKMYAFFSGYQLTNDPGTKHFHGGVDLGLLGQAMALKAGRDYELLMVDRIFRPLKMDGTRFTLTPELKSRLATEHDDFGYAVSNIDWGVMNPLAGLHTTANDMLKFTSANLGLTPSSLTPLMGKALQLRFNPQGGNIVHIPGVTISYSFDRMRRRGVVVLSSSFDWPDLGTIGRFLLESCEWQSDRRPAKTNISSQVYGSYVGQYCAVGARSQPGIGIRREGDRIFAQATGSGSQPMDVLLPPGAGELLPESETRFFERLSGLPVTFSQDARGKVTGLTMHYQGDTFSYEKISDEPPKALEPPKQPLVIKLDTKLLDACVGHYEFGPDAAFPTGMKLAVWREGDQLVGQAWGAGHNFLHGAFDMYPESETNFFDKILCGQLTFIKNDKGEVTAVILHPAGLPDSEGKKLKN